MLQIGGRRRKKFDIRINTKAVNCRIIDELERVWKEAVLT
jgi:hypothetical protein